MNKTPLLWASYFNHQGIAEMLGNEGTFTNATDDKENETALHEAAANGHDAVARLLIKGKVDVNAKQFVSSDVH